VEPRGKRAVTHYTVLEPLGRFALLELRLETGRTHQIRAHLAARDWPVLGDPLYGGRRYRGLALTDALHTLLGGMQRQALHAAELGFVHPILGTAQMFAAPLPADMQTVLDALRAAC
jgi:23S rRNA pseudouridine1911/1915/1917 synthase